MCCFQVDCLKTVCGLTPFANPDQMQRLGFALFLHAGLVYNNNQPVFNINFNDSFCRVFVMLIFNSFILRNLK